LTLLIDAGPIVALADLGEPQRESILTALRDEPGDLVVPARRPRRSTTFLANASVRELVADS
jgi:hypothetical protein